MSSRNATVIILECFALCCALFVVSSTQAKYAHWIHRHHHHGVQVKNPDTQDTERQDPVRLHVMSAHHLRVKHRRHHGDNEHNSFIEKPRTLDALEKENHHLRVLPTLRRSHAIKKRQDLSKVDYNMKNWELDVKELQNRSLCNYTVEPVIDESINQTRIPKDLVHIKCNHVGSPCPHVDIPNTDSCCTQTFRNIEVSYGEGEKPEIITILTGCVCSVRERRDTYRRLENGKLI